MTPETTETFVEQQIPTNPFPGLRPFDFEESHLFFGRDGQSEQLITKLGATHFLAVVGTSGSGKSSLVRAGLMPSLLGGFMTTAGSNWKIAVMRPGNDPIGKLAQALNSPNVFGSEIPENAALQTVLSEATLQRGSLGLIDAVRHAGIAGDENLLVVVDQFEEIFRFAKVREEIEYRNEAAAFVKLLLEAARQLESRIYVVLTMRSDYLGDCSQFWGLPEAINESQYLIPRLTRDQLKEAITGPISVAHGQITPRLLARLLNEVGEDQDQLPMLQHLLMRVWDEWKEKSLIVELTEDGKTITTPHNKAHTGEEIDLCCYEAVGGMAHALSRHADEALNDLAMIDNQGSETPRSVLVAKKIFQALTEKGTDNREIRRPATLSELGAIAEANETEVVTVIETFRRSGRSFLMPPAGVALAPDSLVDISHESLIRAWTRLNEWVEDESRSARIYRRLADTAVLESENRAGLWRDPDLQVALTWLQEAQPNKVWAQRYHHEFDRAMNFLARSVEARDIQIRNIEHERRRAITRTRLTAIVFAILFLVALVALFFANQQRIKANGLLEQVERTSQAAKETALREQKAQLASDEAQRQRAAADAFAKQSEELAREALSQKGIAEAQTKKVQDLEKKARKDADEAREINSLTRLVNDNLAQKNVESAIINASKLAEHYKQKDDPRGEFESQTILASAYLQLGKYSEARDAATRALTIHEKNQIDNSREQHENLSVLRDSYLKQAAESIRQDTRLEDQRDLSEAFRIGSQALKIQEGIFGPTNRAIIPDLASLASISEKRNQPSAARSYRQRIVSIQEETIRTANLELATYLTEFGKFNQSWKDYEAAAKQFNDALSIFRQLSLKDDDSLIISTLNSLVEVYRADKKDSRAEEIVQQIQRLEGKAAILRKGASGPQVKALQENLQRLGFFTGSLDGYFGPSTEDAVIKFQTSKGLQADGIVGPGTSELLERGRTTELATIKDVQNKLKELGFNPGPIDGSFGFTTKAALMSFQRSKGLIADGSLNPETLRALGLAPSSGLPSVTGKVTVDLVRQMFPGVPEQNITANLPFVLRALEDAGLADREMVLLALALIRADTRNFTPLSEYQSRFNTSPGGRPFDLYDNRKDLGNQGPPDGERFKGRGYIQITGRANYQIYGAAIGLGDQLVQYPNLANDPSIAASILAQTLKSQETRLRSALAQGDLRTARKIWVGGSSGLDAFIQAYNTGASLLQ